VIQIEKFAQACVVSNGEFLDHHTSVAQLSSLANGARGCTADVDRQ
jgi:hypothetical protein